MSPARRPAAPPRRRELLLCAVWSVLFAAAPTVGDVGACNDAATPLSLPAFQAARKAVDCQRCNACGLTTKTCQDACDPKKPSDVSWPTTCYPLSWDGTVCIDALEAASCGAYASYVSDTAPTVPTECDFCHVVPDAAPHTGDL